MLKYYIYLYTKMAKKSTVKLNFMEKITGAGNGNRTRFLSLARIHNNHYTIPAGLFTISYFRFQILNQKSQI